jgi:hypothetical protein
LDEETPPSDTSRLPDSARSVGLEHRVAADDAEVAPESSHDHQSIKRASMMARQIHDPRGIVEGDKLPMPLD